MSVSQSLQTQTKAKCTSQHDWYITIIFIPYFLTFKIVTIIILEFACRFRASSPGSTPEKALDKAYSKYKKSGNHEDVKEKFLGHHNQYSVPEFTEFILQHRLQV